MSRFISRRGISQLAQSWNGKRANLVDNLAMVQKLEAQGLPSKTAKAITSGINEVLNDCLDNVAHFSVFRREMESSKMMQESNLSKFKSTVLTSEEIYELKAKLEAKRIKQTISAYYCGAGLILASVCWVVEFFEFF